MHMKLKTTPCGPQEMLTQCLISGKIGTFYLIFYIVLASMFGIMLWIFYHTLDPRVPRWTLGDSLIGKSPG